MTLRAVVDLTEMVRLAMQRPERSPLFRAWEAHSFTWTVDQPKRATNSAAERMRMPSYLPRSRR